MVCPELAPRTFVLKYILCCRKAHAKEVKTIVEKVDGVTSVKMNIEECKAQISGTVEPVIVIAFALALALALAFSWIALTLDLKAFSWIVLAFTLALKAFSWIDLALTLALKAFPWIALALALTLALKAVLDKLIGKSTSDCYHKHELELRSNNKRFTCDGCKEDGFGFRYRCKQCDYELHEECKVQKPIISPKLFQGSTFQFRQNSYFKGQPRCCDACGKNIYGYSYHCEANDLDLRFKKKKDLNLHPRCCNLEEKLEIDGTVFALRYKDLSKCLWCEKKENSGTRGRVPGCSYVSACKKYKFHVYCIAEMVHEARKKGADHTEDTSMALKQVDLQLMAKNSNRNGRRGSNQCLKTLKIFISTIIAIFLGDPTALLASTVVGLLSS